MWFYGLVFVIFVALSILIVREDSLEPSLAIVTLWLIGGFVSLLLSIPVLGFTTGFYNGYSTGTRDGFLTKVSDKGVIFKTHEAQIQVGTGQMAALQEPFEFSIKDDAVFQDIQSLLGERVRIKYSQWLIQPFRHGGSDYECTSVELLGEAND